MSPELRQIIAYVDAASDLAEQVTADLKTKDRKVSDETVLKLSKFIAKAGAFQKLLDSVEAARVKLN